MAGSTDDKNDMMTEVVHELKDCVNIIFENIDVILQETANDTVREGADKIKQAAQNIALLLQKCEENPEDCLNNSSEKLLSEEMLGRLKTGRVCREDLSHIIEKLIFSLQNYQIEQAEELFYRLAQCLYGDESIDSHLHGAEVYMLSDDYQGVIDELSKILNQI